MCVLQVCPFSGMPLSTATLNGGPHSDIDDDLCNLSLNDDVMRSRSMTWTSQCTNAQQHYCDLKSDSKHCKSAQGTSSLPQLPQDECLPGTVHDFEHFKFSKLNCCKFQVNVFTINCMCKTFGKTFEPERDWQTDRQMEKLQCLVLLRYQCSIDNKSN